MNQKLKKTPLRLLKMREVVVLALGEKELNQMNQKLKMTSLHLLELMMEVVVLALGEEEQYQMNQRLMEFEKFWVLEGLSRKNQIWKMMHYFPEMVMD